MRLFLLAQTEVWYIWPETNAYTVLQVFIFILLFLLVVLVGRLLFLQKKTTSSTWTHILNYAYNKKLSSKEISVLEHFFNSLDISVREKASLLSDKKLFQSYLYSYLNKYHSDSVESYVRILDKLFPISNNLEIKSLLDIHVGEVCAIEFEEIYFLARVMNKTHREILLSIHDNALKRDKEGADVKLYFYRNNLGGFLVPGVVKKINVNGILFFQEGDILSKGEEHLVAEVVKDVELFPWGISTQDSSLSLHDKENTIYLKELIPEELSLPEEPDAISSNENPTSREPELPKEQDPALSLKATMIRLSDRAILLNIKDPFFNDAVLRKIDIWEMHVNLNYGTTPLVMKGKIMKSDRFSESFIFKFVAPSESDIKLIFDEIKKHSPTRGFIS